MVAEKTTWIKNQRGREKNRTYSSCHYVRFHPKQIVITYARVSRWNKKENTLTNTGGRCRCRCVYMREGWGPRVKKMGKTFLESYTHTYCRDPKIVNLLISRKILEVTCCPPDTYWTYPPWHLHRVAFTRYWRSTETIKLMARRGVLRFTWKLLSRMHAFFIGELQSCNGFFFQLCIIMRAVKISIILINVNRVNSFLWPVYFSRDVLKHFHEEWKSKD